MHARSGVGWYYLVFFLGGIPALIYQVVWQRVLKLYFGVDIESTAVIVASFMLGLGLGAVIGGRLADRSRRPGVLYAVVEFALGVFGVASLWLFSSIGDRLAGAGTEVVFVASFALLLIPTTLMGMTLPLVSRAVIASESAIGRHFAYLYAVNTLGAAVGALITAYVLCGFFGLRGATFIAAGVNFLLPVLILRSALQPRVVEASSARDRSMRSVSTTAPRDEAGARESISLATFAWLAFLSGFTALGYELVWYRLLGCLLHSTVYVFGTILAVYLIGIGWGSLASRKTIDQPGAAGRFAYCQLGIAAYTLALFALLTHGNRLPGIRHFIAASFFTSFHPAPELAAGSYDAISLYSVVGLVFWSIVIVLPPTWLMGYGFPNLVRGASHSLDRLGRSLSLVLFANIVGATLGSLAAGFFGVHYLGSERTLWIFALLSVLTAALTLGVAGPASAAEVRPRGGGFGGVVKPISWAIVLLGLVIFPGPGRILQTVHYANLSGVEFIGTEDRTGVVALRRQEKPITFPQEDRVCGGWRLYIDGSSHGQFPAGLEEVAIHEHLQIALAAHAAPRRALSIGLGDGVMCATLARDPAIEEIVIVELNSALRDVLMKSAQGKAIFERPEKIRYVVDDGRRWLLANRDEKFDFITMFPLHAAHAYYGNLYSTEFLELAKRHLRDDGVFFSASQDPYSTARTIAEAFAHVWRLGHSGYAASNSPLQIARARLQISEAALREAIEADRDEIVKQTAAAPLNTDFSPRSEYYLSYPYARFVAPRLSAVAIPFKMSDSSRAIQWRD